MLGTDIDSPTCGEHGRLATPMHAGAKAMGQVMHRWMGMTDEEIKHDSKYKALFMAVGLNASLVDAPIYAMSIGRGRISREGALDLRESRGRHDKIFAEKTESSKILDQKPQFSVGNFLFFGRGKTNFWGGVITSKLASQ